MTKAVEQSYAETWNFCAIRASSPPVFREMTARWQYTEAITCPGITALGLGLGTHDATSAGIKPVIRGCGQ